jgi:glucosylceramidase
MNHNHKCILLVFLFLLLVGICTFSIFKERAENQESSEERKEASIWLTTGDQNNLLTKKAPLSFSKKEEKKVRTITIDRNTRYQTMDGFGAAMTGSSAYLINKKFEKSARETLLKDLFTTKGIHMNYVRHTIGASDFSVDENGFATSYTYADEPDIRLSHFSVDKDQEVIQILQEARNENQNLKIMGTPWTAPSWMK